MTKTFGTTVAVNDVSLRINRGSITALIGPNGAGKSTFINLATGLISPTSGRISVFGRCPSSGNHHLTRKMGVLLQGTILFPRATVKEYFDLYGRIFNLPESEQRRVAGWMGLDEYLDTTVGDLSGGWQQRLALGLALVNDPDLVVLDEPTVGLDPMVRRDLWKLIRELRDLGKTILVTTHYMDEAIGLSDTLVMMHEGRIRYCGTPDQVEAHGKRLEGGLDEAFEKYVCGEIVS